MKTPRALALAFAAALVALSAAQAADAPKSRKAHADAPKVEGLPGVFYDDAYVIGSPKAKVTIVEYASPVCPHCAHFDAEMFPKIKAKYIDTGLARFEFREMLTAPEELAASALIVARCTGKDHYFAVIEAFFRAQPDMASGRPGTGPVDTLSRLARENGADSARFQACLSDPHAVERLNARIDHALNVDKINSTPTVFVNGTKVDPGLSEWSIEKIDAVVGPALKASGTKGR